MFEYPAVPEPDGDRAVSLGIAGWLLVSGLNQIESELAHGLGILQRSPLSWSRRALLEGRIRELRAARGFLLWLWGPLAMAWPADQPPPGGTPVAIASTPPQPAAPLITLRNRTALALWEAIQVRLERAISHGLDNRTGQLLAVEGLAVQRRREQGAGGPDRHPLAHTVSPACPTRVHQPDLRVVLLQELAERLLLLEAQAGRGLVEQQQGRVAGQGARDLHQPLLAERDVVLVGLYHGGYVAANLPSAQANTVPGAGHFAFMAQSVWPLASEAGDAAANPEGFDRVAYHATLENEVAEFLARQLR